MAGLAIAVYSGERCGHGLLVFLVIKQSESCVGVWFNKAYICPDIKADFRLSLGIFD